MPSWGNPKQPRTPSACCHGCACSAHAQPVAQSAALKNFVAVFTRFVSHGPWALAGGQSQTGEGTETFLFSHHPGRALAAPGAECRCHCRGGWRRPSRATSDSSFISPTRQPLLSQPASLALLATLGQAPAQQWFLGCRQHRMGEASAPCLSACCVI